MHFHWLRHTVVCTSELANQKASWLNLPFAVSPRRTWGKHFFVLDNSFVNMPLGWYDYARPTLTPFWPRPHLDSNCTPLPCPPSGQKGPNAERGPQIGPLHPSGHRSWVCWEKRDALLNCRKCCSKSCRGPSQDQKKHRGKSLGPKQPLYPFFHHLRKLRQFSRCPPPSTTAPQWCLRACLYTCSRNKKPLLESKSKPALRKRFLLEKSTSSA